MKRSSAVNTLCTLTFIFGVLVGTLMHGHLRVHDVFAAIVAGMIVSFIRITEFRLLAKKVLAKLFNNQ